MIRESVKELAKRGHEITIEEWNNTPLNTYERNYLYEFLPNATFIEVAKYHNKHTEVVARPVTYNEAVIAYLFPELIRRLEELSNSVKHYNETIEPEFKKKYSNLKHKVQAFLNDSSWNRYKEVVKQIEMKGPEIQHSVQCGIVPFMELEQAITK